MFKTKSKGFTFIEIIIAMAILVVGILGIAALFPVGIKASARAVNLTKAALLGQTVLEEIKRDGYDSLSGDSGVRETVESDDYPGFSYRVEWLPVEGVEYLKDITVTISWNEGNTQRSRNFITYLSR